MTSTVRDRARSVATASVMSFGLVISLVLIVVLVWALAALGSVLFEGGGSGGLD